MATIHMHIYSSYIHEINSQKKLKILDLLLDKLI